jgi:hypothetical protein
VSKSERRVEYPVRWVRVRRNIMFAQAKNCLLFIQVGTVGIFFGVGTRPKGYGARVELFAPGRRFRVRHGCWYELDYYERQRLLEKQEAKGE